MATDTGAQGIVSDDFFEGTLGGHWTVIDDTSGDVGTQSFEGAGTSDARMTLALPSSGNYDMWGTWQTIYVEQTCTNGDFQIEAKFDLTTGVPQDAQFGIFSRDNTAGEWPMIRVKGNASDISVVAMSSTGNGNHGTATISAPSNLWLRLDRTTNDWTAEYSINGTGWTELGTGWTDTRTIDYVGWGIGSVANESPAWTCRCDYFFENDARIDPEDSGGRMMFR